VGISLRKPQEVKIEEMLTQECHQTNPLSGFLQLGQCMHRHRR